MKNRYINTKFWDDPWIIDLQPMERYLFFYLLTNDHTNLAGVYELSLTGMARETGIEKEVLSRMLSRFGNDKKAYYLDNWVYLTNFIKNQSSNPKIKKGIANTISELPENIRIKALEFIPHLKSITGYDSLLRPINRQSEKKQTGEFPKNSKKTSKKLDLLEIAKPQLGEGLPTTHDSLLKPTVYSNSNLNINIEKENFEIQNSAHIKKEEKGKTPEEEIVEEIETAEVVKGREKGETIGLIEEEQPPRIEELQKKLKAKGIVLADEYTPDYDSPRKHKKKRINKGLEATKWMLELVKKLKVEQGFKAIQAEPQYHALSGIRDLLIANGENLFGQDLSIRIWNVFLKHKENDKKWMNSPADFLSLKGQWHKNDRAEETINKKTQWAKPTDLAQLIKDNSS